MRDTPRTTRRAPGPRGALGMDPIGGGPRETGAPGQTDGSRADPAGRSGQHRRSLPAARERRRRRPSRVDRRDRWNRVECGGGRRRRAVRRASPAKRACVAVSAGASRQCSGRGTHPRTRRLPPGAAHRHCFHRQPGRTSRSRPRCVGSIGAGHCGSARSPGRGRRSRDTTGDRPDDALGDRRSRNAGCFRRSVPRDRGAARRRPPGQRASVLLHPRSPAERQRILRRRDPSAPAVSRGKRRGCHPPCAHRSCRLLSGCRAGQLRRVRRRDHRGSDARAGEHTAR